MRARVGVMSPMLNMAPIHTATMIATPITIGKSILLIGYRLQWVNKLSSLTPIAAGIKYPSAIIKISYAIGELNQEDSDESVNHRGE